MCSCILSGHQERLTNKMLHFEHLAVSEHLKATIKTSIRVLHVSEQASKWLSVYPVNHLILLQNQLLQHISIATQADNDKMILHSYSRSKKLSKISKICLFIMQIQMIQHHFNGIVKIKNIITFFGWLRHSMDTLCNCSDVWLQDRKLEQQVEQPSLFIKKEIMLQPQPHIDLLIRQVYS